MSGLLMALGDPVKEVLEEFSIEKFDQFFVQYKMYEAMFGHPLFREVVVQILKKPCLCPHSMKFFTYFVRCGVLNEEDILFALKKALSTMRWVHALSLMEFLCKTSLVEGADPMFTPQTLMKAFHASLPVFKAKKAFVVMVFQRKKELAIPFQAVLMDWYNTNHVVS